MRRLVPLLVLALVPFNAGGEDELYSSAAAMVCSDAGCTTDSCVAEQSQEQRGHCVPEALIQTLARPVPAGANDLYEPFANLSYSQPREGHEMDYLAASDTHQGWPCGEYRTRTMKMMLSCLRFRGTNMIGTAQGFRSRLEAALTAAGRANLPVTQCGTTTCQSASCLLANYCWNGLQQLSATLMREREACTGDACRRNLRTAANLAAGASQNGEMGRRLNDLRHAMEGRYVNSLLPQGHRFSVDLDADLMAAAPAPRRRGGSGGQRAGGQPGGGRPGSSRAQTQAQSQGQAQVPDALSMAFAGLMNGRPAQGVQQHCPSVPAYYCGGGGAYDPATLVSRLPGDFHRTPLDTLSSQLYDLVATDFKVDLQAWLLDLYVERYMQISAINGRLGELNPVASSALVQAGHACSARLDTRVERAITEVSGIPMDTARANRRHELVAASMCAMQLMERERWLRHTLVLDQDIVIRPGGPSSRGEAVAEGLIGLIPTMPAFQYMMRHVPVLALQRGATEECSIPRLVPMLARNDPHWQPTDYHFEPADLEREIQSGRVRRNGNAIEEAIPRQVYCGNVAQEYVGVGHQFNQLMTAYPELAQSVGNRPMYQHVAELGGRRDCAAGDTSDYCRVRRYSLDPYRDVTQDPDRVNGQYPGGQRLACMDLFQQQRPLPPTYRINESENAARFSEVDTLMRETGANSVVDAQLSSLRTQIGRLCEDRDTVLTEAIRNPDIMSRFFSCSSRPYGQIRDNAQQPSTAGVQTLGGGPCRDRMNSTWIACRMFEDARQSDEDWAVAGEIADLAFTALGTGAGMSNPVVSWGGAGTFMRQTAFGGLAAAAFTYPEIRQMTAERDAAQGSVANFNAGIASFESFQDATTVLNRWAHNDPVISALITNVIIGAGTAALQTGGHVGANEGAPHSPEFITSARRQRELIQLEGLYNDLMHDPGTGANHFASNPAAQRSLEHLIDDALRAESPGLAANRPAFAALTATPEGRLALLRERTSARNLSREHLAVVDAAFNEAETLHGVDMNTPAGRDFARTHLDARAALQEALSNPDPAYNSLRSDFETLRASLDRISDPATRRSLIGDLRQRLLSCGV